MLRRYWLVLLLVGVPALFAGLIFGCSHVGDDDDHNGGEPSPPYYDPTMIGWAFGDGVYRFDQGRWNRDSNGPSGAVFVGASFTNRELGVAFTVQRIYRFTDGAWSDVTPPDYPSGASMFAGMQTSDGTVWIAANDTAANGYMIRIGADGTENVYAMAQVLNKTPVRLTAVAPAPGSTTVFFVAEFDGYLQVVAWDGAQAISAIPIIQQSTDAPVDVLSVAVGPDGLLWVTGYDRQDGPQVGVIWHQKPDSAEWNRIQAVASSTCQTVSVRRIYFTAQSTGYAIAQCLWSQIYHSADLASWTEMSLPGSKGDKYQIDDLSMLTDTHGWAVGYTDQFNGPLLLLRNSNGWIEAVPQTYNQGDHLHAVAVFDLPAPVQDDDTVTDDDAIDDDAVIDDDTAATRS
jgi:hypothetical protein